MKAAILLIALACPLRAELVAMFQTTQGTVAAVLQFDKAPQAVANFITLVQATRNRVDPSTGAVIKAPLYLGEKFYRVVNDADFKIAQTGSGTGTTIGGPGFTFKDEFNASLTHVPYVLSMANSGPNTNGSQIFFTGNATIPSLDNVHTVFGLVTDAASRSVIDAIHAAGSGGTSIIDITFSRSDPAALAFDELAQGLPEVTRPDGYLTVIPGESAIWHFDQAMTPGAVFKVFRSSTLAPGSWSALASARRHVGIAAPPTEPSVEVVLLDDATAPSAYYNLALARHPGALAPSSLANCTVRIPLGANELTYVFDASGAAGTTTYAPAAGTPIVGPFTSVSPSNGLPQAPSSDAHNIVFTAYTPALSRPYLWIKIGCDSATTTTITGHHSTQYYDYGWQFFSKGSATISR